MKDDYSSQTHLEARLRVERCSQQGLCPHTLLLCKGTNTLTQDLPSYLKLKERKIGQGSYDELK